MKNLIITLIAALVLALTGCAKSDPVDKAVDILEKASAKVEKASTEDEAMEITRTTAEELKELKLDDRQLTPSEQGRLSNAIMGFMQACMKSKIDFTKGTEVLNLTDSPADRIDEAELPADSE